MTTSDHQITNGDVAPCGKENQLGPFNKTTTYITQSESSTFFHTLALKAGLEGQHVTEPVLDLEAFLKVKPHRET